MGTDDGPEMTAAFFERMVESVGVGVGIYDADGAYCYVNDAYASMFGVDREALVGTPIWEVVTGFDRERFDDYWASFEEGETRVDEAEHAFAGVSLPVSTVTTRRHIDGVPYHFGTMQDITEQRERERELEARNERLEAFTGIVSHDLRNPLGVAKGYVELAREECDADELDLAESALCRMETLVDDLLTLAREGQSLEDTRPTSISYVASNAWENVDTGNADLDVEDLFTVEADAGRLQQLFENLFRNSVEHGGEAVTVRVGRLNDVPGFFIEDDGPGIGEEKEQVFEPGYTSREDGTGFGLAIVEEVADAHGWTVTLSGESDEGARFEIRIGGE
jgi:PAS domain S-box-containing protein